MRHGATALKKWSPDGVTWDWGVSVREGAVLPHGDTLTVLRLCTQALGMERYEMRNRRLRGYHCRDQVNKPFVRINPLDRARIFPNLLDVNGPALVSEDPISDYPAHFRGALTYTRYEQAHPPHHTSSTHLC